jgi:hypothetical protein
MASAASGTHMNEIDGGGPCWLPGINAVSAAVLIIRIRNLNWSGLGLDRLHLILHEVRELFCRYVIPKQ